MMLKQRKWLRYPVALALLALLLAGCGGGDQEGQQQSSEGGAESAVEPSKPIDEPVTLMFYNKLSMTDDAFEQYIGEPVRVKFPFVTLNRVKNAQGMTPADLVTRGEIPDLIWEGLTNINGLIDFDFPMGLDDLVSKHQFDLNRIEPEVVNYIRSFSDKNELIYLPYLRYPFVLHWNKGIFDKFGVPTPPNGMTWEETAQLAHRVSREDGGFVYRGLVGGVNLNRIHTQVSLNFIDPKTEKSVLLSNNLWQDVFRIYHRIYNVPGNYPEGSKFNDGVNLFIRDQRLAMFPHLSLISNGTFIEAVQSGLDWGISTYPTWPGQPDIGPGVISDGIVIPKHTKHPDVSFRIAAHLLSDEVQTKAARLGSPTALISPEVRKHLYAESPIVQGKDLSPLFALKSAPPYLTTPYDSKANINIVTKIVEEYYTNKIDLNTALRTADEEINRMIETEKALKKQ